MYVALLIVHGLFAVALLGAITHQTASTWLPARKQAGSFGGRFRAVSAAGYSNAIVVLYACTFVLGAIIYPEFRISIRGVLEELDTPAAMGSFELKEHFASSAWRSCPPTGICGVCRSRTRTAARVKQ